MDYGLWSSFAGFGKWQRAGGGGLGEKGVSILPGFLRTDVSLNYLISLKLEFGGILFITLIP